MNQTLDATNDALTAARRAPSLVESIRTAHLSAAGAERTLDELIGSLSGEGQTGIAGATQIQAVKSTCAEAQELSCRIEAIARRLTRVQELVTGANLNQDDQGGGYGRRDPARMAQAPGWYSAIDDAVHHAQAQGRARSLNDGKLPQRDTLR